MIYHSDQNICKYSKYFIIHALNVCTLCSHFCILLLCIFEREHKLIKTKEEKGKKHIGFTHIHICKIITFCISRDNLLSVKKKIYLGFKDFLVVNSLIVIQVNNYQLSPIMLKLNTQGYWCTTAVSYILIS